MKKDKPTTKSNVLKLKPKKSDKVYVASEDEDRAYTDSNYITEILPDLDKMPEWARKAFLDGQFFAVAFKRVEGLEADVNERATCINGLEVALKEYGHDKDTSWKRIRELEDEAKRSHRVNKKIISGLKKRSTRSYHGLIENKLKIAEGYLCSLVVTHPHLVPNEKLSDGNYRLTIYDTEEQTNG